MTDVGGSNRQRKKKKDKKDRIISDASSASPDHCEGSEDAVFEFQVLSVGGPKSKADRSPVAVLPAKELRRAGLEAGDPVLVKAAAGHFTVAVCEAGGRDGGIILPRTVLQSIGADVGDIINLVSDFEAHEAADVEFEISDDLLSAWPDVAGNSLHLQQYLIAVFDSTLVVNGDVRMLSISGRQWQIIVHACHGAKTSSDPGVSNLELVEKQGPWLITKRTKVRLHSSSNSASDNPPSNSSATDEQKANPLNPYGLARVGGLRGVIDELREAVQMPLERPEVYRQLGIAPPRGVLLYGPPGTGKTLLARSLAEEMRCPVELCSSTDFVGAGIGETEGRIKAIFERCRKLADNRGTGALLFIDEIDAVCPKRDDSSEVERRMVAAFLVALDGARSSNDSVVVLGATNRPDAIDPALRRAGRLEREVEVGVPNAEERRQILGVHLASLRHSLSQEDQQNLARRCHGYVGADLRALCMAAARAALKNGCEQVNLEHCLDAARLVPPSALKELLVEVPEVRWDDIGGYDRTKDAMREAVEWPIKFAWVFDDMCIEPPRGVLLYGPPGCSKTMMAKAVATETEMNFVSIKGPELFSKYVGDSERAVRDVFRKARTAAPCVVFFDEIDAVGASREGEGAGSVSARVLAQLLAEMDGIGASGPKRHVVVLAATNRPHVLDPALMRPGRFDRLVHVPLPDESARGLIFARQLARMRTGTGVDAATLASRTEWCSGAEVVMVCREAAMLAIRDALDNRCDNSDPTTAPCAQVSHFDKALSTVRPRIDRETIRFYEEFERRIQQN